VLASNFSCCSLLFLQARFSAMIRSSGKSLLSKGSFPLINCCSLFSEVYPTSFRK
jgi:hypothetical protein